MAALSLKELIHAIAGAIVEAQDQIQRFQIATVQGYFDEDDRPRAVDIRIPSMSSSGESDEERTVHVPLLSLVGAHLLKIKEAAVEFEVGLGAAEDAHPAKDGTAEADDVAADTNRHKELGVDMNASSKRSSGTMARVTLKVETMTPNDGMARLLQHLDKLI